MTIALRRSTPEAEGLRSSAVEEWIAAAGRGANELHSVMILRHGAVVAERWWEPYRPDAVHLLYSLSKSFTSTAVGFAVAEGLIGLDDLVVERFADVAPVEIGENLAGLRVRHLLSMSAGHADDSTFTITESNDWARSFLEQPFAHPPGTEFLYDSGASFMLSALVQRVTGEPLLDYLRPRLFDPLGIGHIETQSSPEGIATGGWGMSATTEALAAFGLLYLQDGVWKGERVLPDGWVAEATRPHIMQPADFNTVDWRQGYGFQFWRCRHGAFRGDGAFGQFVVVMPEQDAVVVVTSHSPDMQAVLDAIWDVLLPAMGDAPLPPAPPAHHVTASLPAPEPAPEFPAPPLGETRFALDANALGYETLTMIVGEDTVTLEFGGQRVETGIGRWIDGSLAMPSTPPEVTPAFRDRHASGAAPLAARGAWIDPDVFQARWQYYTTPHHDTVTVSDGVDRVRVEFLNSITAAATAVYPTLPAGMEESRPVLTGTRIVPGH